MGQKCTLFDFNFGTTDLLNLDRVKGPGSRARVFGLRVQGSGFRAVGLYNPRIHVARTAETPNVCRSGPSPCRQGS